MCDPPRAERPLCSFCLTNVVVHSREPTIFGAVDVCDECLRNYRRQLSWAVHELNLDDWPAQEDAALAGTVSVPRGGWQEARHRDDAG